MSPAETKRELVKECPQVAEQVATQPWWHDLLPWKPSVLDAQTCWPSDRYPTPDGTWRCRVHDDGGQ